MRTALVALITAETRRARHSFTTYCLAWAVLGAAGAHLADLYAPLL